VLPLALAAISLLKCSPADRHFQGGVLGGCEDDLAIVAALDRVQRLALDEEAGQAGHCDFR
ncbi:MAG: hypothetical protein ACREV0_13815, partial [Burkholderiales bacterium]